MGRASRDADRKKTRRDAWPCASHQGRMEVAAFPLRCGKTNGKVVIVDSDVFDTMGGKSHGIIHTYYSFFAWFRAAIQEAEEWMTEEDLADILDK